MKKLILFLFLIVLLNSCDSTSNSSEKTIENYNTITIEGCEYIQSLYYSGNIGYGFMAHKGNCNNKVHQCE